MAFRQRFNAGKVGEKLTEQTKSRRAKAKFGLMDVLKYVCGFYDRNPDR